MPHGDNRIGAGRKPIPIDDLFVRLVGQEWERLLKQEGTAYGSRKKLLACLRWQLRSGELERRRRVVLTDAERNACNRTLFRKWAAYRRFKQGETHA